MLIDVDNLWMPQDRQSGFLDFVWHLVEVWLGDLQMFFMVGHPSYGAPNIETDRMQNISIESCSPLKPAPHGMFGGIWALEDSMH
jgi:hypothetical protein